MDPQQKAMHRELNPTRMLRDKDMRAVLGRTPTADERWPDGVIYQGCRWTFSLIWQKWVTYT